ncbi:divalent-cation tolerance protein CutA [Endozoicomonas sp. ALE010]|uniref:divalent-cation tolerance protein CutA n=2 Tax=unclassified Endozoicomonas TaxID=2644528 RepID=UPI003BB71FBC
MPIKPSSGFCMVLTTCPNQQEADDHARAIIEQRLAACVQSSPIHSHYRWDGEVQSDPEVLLRIKTTCERYQALEQYLKAEHSYDVPQVIQIPIENGLPEYLDWVRDETAVIGQ